jgi:hypothetical protein
MKAARLPLLAALAAAFAFGATDAVAQVAPEVPDTDELTTFTEAFVEISVVREEVTPQILQADSQDEAAAIQQEANARMMEILGEHELDADRYNEITQLINSDEELRVRFEATYAELTEDDGGA